jgi:hypothetical protein
MQLDERARVVAWLEKSGLKDPAQPAEQRPVPVVALTADWADWLSGEIRNQVDHEFENRDFAGILRAIGEFMNAALDRLSALESENQALRERLDDVELSIDAAEQPAVNPFKRVDDDDVLPNPLDRKRHAAA